MKKALSIYTSLAILSSTLLAQDIMNDKNIYITASAGYSKVVAKKNDIFNSVVLNNTLDEKTYNFNLGVGYNYEELYFFELNYQRVALKGIDIDNFYANIDYKFLNESKFIPYAGILAGYSRLNWNTHPVSSVNSYSVVSSSVLFGFEAGVTYPITKQFSTELTYQFMKTNHTTKIVKSDSISEIKHSYISSFNLGIRYMF